jgi:phytoene dehydrogenase-like protein
MADGDMSAVDVVVVGGGHNGLTAAAYLARAGRKVVVLERRHLVGGAAVTEELYPGFKYSVASYVVSLLRPEIIRELELPRHGLEILPLESTFTPLPNGDHLVRWADHDLTRREIARHSPLDAEAYDEFGQLMLNMARAVKPILGMIPPNPGSLDPRELLRLGRLGLHLRDLGEKNLYALARLLTMSAADFLDEWFESEVLKATMSASGIIGTFLGPRSPGTAYVLLHHYMGEIDGVFRAWGFARGGNGAVSAAFAGAARRWGAQIRTGAPVAHILLRNGQAAGAVLESGEEIRSKVVVSGLDPRRTFLKLLPPEALPPTFVDAVERYRTRGSSAKVNLALDALPEFSALAGEARAHPGAAPPHLRGAISISPSLDYLEQAYDDARLGAFSRRPYLDVVIPSLIDPGMAPPGKHVMSVFCQYAPYDLGGGWSDAQRQALGQAVIDTLSEYAPNLEESILHCQVLTPWDLEDVFGLTGGNIFQGDLALQQLFFLRPVPGWAGYRTPIPNLYLCGSGTHPGGGVSGAPGRLAALTVLGRDAATRRQE